ncbi:acyltransferase [Pseudoflavonifractor capillosus]|uniref:acyltransferase family protein n=1 Tax=Pseudoflavonifractor capillosus TaxID=106588 RepID=UPI001959CCE2|nr:acyltransferase [Pseudoflavonifractor capillosus]MBM6693276.1 acyltransferase [Pseudoflavonifractor capillosus]
MEKEIIKPVYPGIDIGKFICAFLILFYHYFSEHGSLPGLLGEALSLYAVAVALFMAISGFLLYNKLEKIDSREERWNIVKKQILRIYRIYLLWSIPYLLYTIFRWNWSSISVSFIIWEVQRWVFGSTFYTIWFMPMLAIGILITFWLTEKLPNLVVTVLGVLCWGIGSLSLTYQFIGNQIPGFTRFVEFENLWLGGARGWLFYAFPLILVGKYMVSYTDRMKPLPMACSSCGCTLLMLAEALLIRKISEGHTGIDLTIMMIPTVFCILGFLISLKPFGRRYCAWMRRMSTLIFMTQRLFLTVLPGIFPVFFNTYITVNPFICFVAMCGGTVLFSLSILEISKSKGYIRLLY